MPTAQAQARIDHMVGVAKADGLDFRFDHIKPGNTFDGHRVIHLAHDRGKQDAMKERMMRAYLTEGKAIGEQDVLVELAVDVGLDEQEVRTMLAGERYTREVRQDEALARELGISGVPFFVLAGRLGVSGAQPADTLRSALDKAWNDFAKPGIDSYADGAACGPDGCS
jgi:predicted DsbA family dithiol-disulfide isomerase